MGRPREPVEIGFRQLCALVRSVAAGADEFEWRERIKQRLVDLGFAYPKPHALTAAMDAVDVALRKAGTPRQKDEVLFDATAPAKETGRELTPSEARKALQDVMDRLRKSYGSATMTRLVPGEAPGPKPFVRTTHGETQTLEQVRAYRAGTLKLDDPPQTDARDDVRGSQPRREPGGDDPRS